MPSNYGLNVHIKEVLFYKTLSLFVAIIFLFPIYSSANTGSVPRSYFPTHPNSVNQYTVCQELSIGEFVYDRSGAEYGIVQASKMDAMIGQGWHWTNNCVNFPHDYATPSPKAISRLAMCPSGTEIDFNSTWNKECVWVCPRAQIYVTNACQGRKDSGRSCPSTPNPIHIGSGNKYLEENDLFALTIRFTRHYNSIHSAASTGLGAGWRHTYDRKVQTGTKINGVEVLIVTRPDGPAYRFVPSGDGYTPQDGDVVDHLIETKDLNGTRTGWTYQAAGTHDTEHYDGKGKLIAITARTGLQQKFIYSDGTDGQVSGAGGFVLDSEGNTTAMPLPADLLIHVVDGYNRIIELRYDGLKRIVMLVDPSGAITRFGYDALGNLITVRRPDGVVRRYLYNEAEHTSDVNRPHALTGVVDENGMRVMTYQYDAQGRAIGEVAAQADGNIGRFRLSFSNLMTNVTDPLGTVHIYNFAEIHGGLKLTGQSQPGGSGCGPASSSITYDAHGNISSRIDFNGTQTTYTYDLSRNLETKRVEAAGTPQARTVTTAWHPTYRLPTRIAEPSRLTVNDYDAKGNLLSKTLQATSDATGAAGFDAIPVGTPRIWRWTYNQYGQVLTAVGSRTDVVDKTTYAYDGMGNLITVANAAGHVTTLSHYDLNGRAGRIEDPNGLVTELTYSPRGWLTVRKVGDETTTYDYDGVGQLIKATHPDGSHIAYTYDDAHRLIAMADSAGNRIDYTLDAMGNRLKEAVKDPQGQLARQTTRVYDALNRLQEITGAMQ